MRIITALLLAAAAVPAAAADRSFSVTSFDRVRVEGPYAVTLTTNVSPMARASGSPAALDGLSLRVDGRTLIIRADRSAWGGDPERAAGPVTVRIATHDLSQAALNGSGSLAIDRARGLDFLLLVGGSGSVSIADVDVDRLRVSLLGSGLARVAGKAKTFNGSIQGAGALDASALAAKDAMLSAQGPATLRAKVANSAKIDASGTATITIEGAAACTVKASGSATVSGCR